METKWFLQFEITIHVLVFASFKYLCYGSTDVIILKIILVISVISLDSESDFYGRQILTYKAGYRAVGD